MIYPLLRGGETESAAARCEQLKHLSGLHLDTALGAQIDGRSVCSSIGVWPVQFRLWSHTKSVEEILSSRAMLSPAYALGSKAAPLAQHRERQRSAEPADNGQFRLTCRMTQSCLSWRTTPSPPLKRPSPPVLSRSENRSKTTGNRRSRICQRSLIMLLLARCIDKPTSGSVMRVLVM